MASINCEHKGKLIFNGRVHDIVLFSYSVDYDIDIESTVDPFVRRSELKQLCNVSFEFRIKNAPNSKKLRHDLSYAQGQTLRIQLDDTEWEVVDFFTANTEAHPESLDMIRMSATLIAREVICQDTYPIPESISLTPTQEFLHETTNPI